MDDLQKLSFRMQCLDHAVQVCRMNNDTYGVVSKAEEYWKWLVKGQALMPAEVPSSEDDIPF